MTKPLLKDFHHVAIICSDYERSKIFYTKILGFKIEREVFREDRQSFKLDLSLNGKYILELFSFPNSPLRVTQPEATGLRHIAFRVSNLSETIHYLTDLGIKTEPIRVDEYTNKRYTFFNDPDKLPIELYEIEIS